MNWLINLLIPRKTGTIRINRDHLPGLTPPKAAPFIPRSSRRDEPTGTNINALYEKFIKSGASTRVKRTKKNRGVGF